MGPVKYVPTIASSGQTFTTRSDTDEENGNKCCGGIEVEVGLEGRKVRREENKNFGESHGKKLSIYRWIVYW